MEVFFAAASEEEEALLFSLATVGLTRGWMHMCLRDPSTAWLGLYRVLRSSFTTCDNWECVRDAYMMTGGLLVLGTGAASSSPFCLPLSLNGRVC